MSSTKNTASRVEAYGVLALALLLWLVVFFLNIRWTGVLGDFAAWLGHPQAVFTRLALPGFGKELLLVFEVFLLVFCISRLPVFAEAGFLTRWTVAAVAGAGAAGVTGLGLALGRRLTPFYLNLCLWVLILALALYARRTKRLGFRRIKFEKHNFLLLPLALPVPAWYFLSVFSPITNYDSLVYHATMAATVFHHHGIPLIAGPSVGLPASANYPPLFPVLGALSYTQTGGAADIYLRCLGPTFSLLTVLVTYSMTYLLTQRRSLALMAAGLLVTTPLFVSQTIAATAYPVLALFISAAVLCLVLAVKEDKKGYIILSGLIYGFALLTSYEALFCLPAVIGVVVYFYLKRRGFILPFIVPVLAVGSVWFIRNWAALGNPVYPFFSSFLGGIYLDPAILAASMQIIRDTGQASTFGTPAAPTLLGWANLIFLQRHLIPSFGFLLFSSLVWIKSQITRHGPVILAVLGFIFFPLVGFMVFPAHFLRYFTAVLPLAAVLAPMLFLPALGGVINQRAAHLALAGIILLFAVFPGSLPYIMGKAYPENSARYPPDDTTAYWRNIGQPWQSGIGLNERGETAAWAWLNDNLKPGEKVATLEWRVYYIKEGDTDYIFFLDGREALPLYGQESPAAARQYLFAQGVDYIYYTSQVPLEARLPWTQYLGTALFPAVFENGDYTVYKVGQ